MEAKHCSETCLCFRQTTQRRVSDECSTHSHPRRKTKCRKSVSSGEMRCINLPTFRGYRL